MAKGTVKFFNNAKGFGRASGGGGSGGCLLKNEEGGRHTPFHNKYRPQFRKLLDYGEAGDILMQQLRYTAKTGKSGSASGK